MSYLIPPVISCWLVASIQGGIAAHWKHQTRTLADVKLDLKVSQAVLVFLCFNQITNVL